MTDWTDLGWGPWSPGTRVSGEPGADVRARLDLPATLLPTPGLVQPLLFDPALKHHARAARLGEPSFADADTARAWHDARRAALGRVLAAAARSPHLVLRGSALMRAWFGAAAREPGDLDFVAVPRTLGVEAAPDLLDGIARGAAGGAVRFDADAAVCEDIWTYDRVPGVRLVLPWAADGLPGGTVQVDVVFGERLAVPPEPVSVPVPGGEPVRLPGASRELSLAWKIMWLVDDMYPQGKDLYDALLLAESTPLRHRLLLDVFAASEPARAVRPPTFEDVRRIGADWDEFRKEHPDVALDGRAAHARLAALLEPVFAQDTGLPDDVYGRAAELLRPRLADYRGLGLSAALHRMIRDDRFAPLEATVLANVLLGRDAAALGDTVDAVLRACRRVGRGWTGYLDRNPGVRDDVLRTLAGS
ncbi:nucleotidyl transferase AbiEii/AbiGii toxin family protein [Actinomadura atramentaria]|uniref:nucleotidyl transferase AbiEii/AbiGii toxin family protein n=1 Tax=Actinomadura atramentaria TaxID=1990 RepID=UPI00037A2490|nr:nucleotidyl transferase AbiEii/AbiGii toxin family protein [Actinomadura atramentaria]